jgi:hypothetical protein
MVGECYTRLQSPLPNPRLQRTPSAPLSRQPLGAIKAGPLAMFVLAFTVSCTHAQPDFYGEQLVGLPELGSKVQSSGEGVRIVLLSRAGTRQTFGVRVAKVRYDIMVDASDKHVVSISTNDPQFRSPEGARIGDPESRVAALAGRWTPDHRRYVLESGWEAMFLGGDKVFQFEKNTPDGA